MLAPHHTQYPGATGAQIQRLFVGLDFGTAFTKVVIAGSSDSFAVKLRPALRGVDGYLQPGLVAQDMDGRPRLLDAPDEGHSLQNLKLALMQVPENAMARANAAVFLALVLKQARAQFMADHRDIFRNSRLDWHLNIGLPAASFDNLQLLAAFQTVAEIAWMLSVLDVPLAGRMFDVARWAVRVPEPLNDPRLAVVRARFIHPDHIGVLPEVQAETICYATSPLRSNGLHLLVDVGAGTLDVNVFALVTNADDDRYVSHCAKVFPFGTAHLAKHRLNQLEIRGKLRDRPLVSQFTEYAAMPGRRELARDFQVSEDDIEDIDGAFLNQVGTAIWDAVNSVRQQFGNKVHQWRHDRLPAFLAGGGSADDAYHDRLRLVHIHRGLYGWAGLEIRSLPKPARLRMPGVPEPSFHRLAVAYGLAHDLLNLGDFIPPDQTQVTPAVPGPDYRANYPGQEQM
ncbi:hypothetical protein [uncultured Thiodictyon sp.]|uniref:hypothetical protein n=1 Tax=uncultured Thiodictyon sp. TaxID=1846217 RepID=UPI0026014CB6|nr:hypothetical protein [uncultured Thiodictyon sp.]